MSGTPYGVFVIESHYRGINRGINRGIHGMWRDFYGTGGDKKKAIEYLNKNHKQGIVTTGSGKIVHIKMTSKKTKPSFSYDKNNQ